MTAVEIEKKNIIKLENQSNNVLWLHVLYQCLIFLYFNVLYKGQGIFSF